MRFRRTVACCAFVVAGAALVGTVLAQDSKKPAAPQGGDMMMPKPGPEHAALKQREGTWDATVKSRMAPGQPESESKGVQTNTMGAGLWLVSEFKGEFAGMPFWGHGITGYDPLKKKYVLTWVDSFGASMLLGEGTADASGKVLTMMVEGGVDMAGKPMKYRQIEEVKDADTIVMTMMTAGPDGKEFPMMTINYKRKK
ncbi:MAG: DUF1579 domain-containing protein [Planctomycetes bacterium]|nr:DUF1579 domain-containing protein [Planctomycetota bacterium]MBI3847043.1 DUF1579 domain-containing protein [Planctomycetota bacterium]